MIDPKDLLTKKERSTFKVVALFGFLMWLAMVTLIIFVAHHFIAKYW